MAVKIPLEYDSNVDFGFSATDDYTPEVEVQQTQQEVASIGEQLQPILTTLDEIQTKIDNLENILEAGITEKFDIDGYKELVKADTLHKLKEVEALIMPLLVNLLKHPERDTIKWPNRKEIIEKQIEKILAITRP